MRAPRAPWRSGSPGSRPPIRDGARRLVGLARTALAERPTLGGIAVLVVLAAVCAVLVVLNLNRIHEAESAADRQGATYAPPLLPESGAPAPRPVVTVIGAAGSAIGAAPSTTTLQPRLSAAEVRVLSAPGLGYVAAPGRRTFESLARTVDPASREVVLLGGGEDGGDSLPVLASAVTRTVAAVEERAPDATVLLVGPVWPAGEPVPDRLSRVRTTLRSAATATGSAWADPIADRWITPDARLLTASGSVTKAGHEAIAGHLARAVADAVTGPSASPSPTRSG